VLPQSLAGLLLIAAGICPGYWWIRVAEERKPRRDRSPLLEAAELISIGGLFSAITFLIVLVIVDSTQLISSSVFLSDPHRYTQHHPIRVVLCVLLGLIVANLSAWLVAKRLYGDESVIVHESALHRAVRAAPPGSRALVTAVLADGTAVSGWFGACTADPASPEEQELLLVRSEDASSDAKAVKVRLKSAAEFVPLNDHCVVLNGSQLASTYVRFVRFPIN
jgi:hypothetical protein